MMNVFPKKVFNKQAVFASAKYGRIEILSMILDNGADINVYNGSLTPFYTALVKDQFDVADYLIKKGASFENENEYGITDFLAICGNGHGYQKQIEYLIDIGADIFHRDRKGRDAIYHAVEGCDAPLVNFLINKGLDINTENYEGVSAAEVAVNSNYHPIIEPFLDNYHMLNVKNKRLLSAYRIEKLFK
jgi:ankyrin repeat protein